MEKDKKFTIQRNRVRITICLLTNLQIYINSWFCKKNSEENAQIYAFCAITA